MKRFKFSRESSARSCLLRQLIKNLILSEGGYMRTTLERAKSCKRIFDRLVTHAKNKNYNMLLYLKRKAMKRLIIYADSMSNRQGGYLRFARLPNRHGDTAKMAVLAMIEPAREAVGELVTTQQNV